MVVAKRFRRILVWPNFDVARAADEAASEESKLCNRLTVWPTDEEAAENAEFDEGGSGGGGDDYVADAVHFASNVGLTIASLTASDSPFLTVSCWCKFDIDDGGKLFLFDYADFGSPDSSLGFGGWLFGTIKTDFSADISMEAAGLSENVWHHLLLSVDTNHGDSAKILKAYVDDVDVTNILSNTGSAYSMPFSGKSLAVCFDGSTNTSVGDFADIWIAPGQFIDLTVEANRRKFIDASGKPVDLGADGSMPTGTAPAVFFSGDATGFATNKGTGGAFTLTGSLTNASTSPSDYGEYVADAVDFTSGDILSKATALTATDSSVGFISGWVNMVDSVTFFRNLDDTLRVTFGVSDRQVHVELAEVSFTNYLSADTDTNVLPDAGVWFHLLFAWDTDFAAASRRLAVYINGTVAPVTFDDDEGVAFDVGWETPENSRMGDVFDNFGAADIGLWIGTNIVLADSTVSPTNLAKFISGGKPVDPATAIAAFGNPAILFSGDAAGFVTNQGTGGAFTLTGSLTNASTSPSD